jgi:hypothetical protein
LIFTNTNVESWDKLEQIKVRGKNRTDTRQGELNHYEEQNSVVCGVARELCTEKGVEGEWSGQGRKSSFPAGLTLHLKMGVVGMSRSLRMRDFLLAEPPQPVPAFSWVLFSLLALSCLALSFRCPSQFLRRSFICRKQQSTDRQTEQSQETRQRSTYKQKTTKNQVGQKSDKSKT